MAAFLSRPQRVNKSNTDTGLNLHVKHNQALCMFEIW